MTPLQTREGDWKLLNQDLIGFQHPADRILLVTTPDITVVEKNKRKNLRMSPRRRGYSW